MTGLTADESAEGVSELQQLLQFKRWSIFLPRVACEQVHYNATYVLARQKGNPAFFEQTKQRLEEILQDCDLLKMSGKICSADDGLAKALDIMLQSLTTSLGFLSNRQFHKALQLGSLCMEVASKLTEGHPDLTFWRLLCSAYMGDTYLRLRRVDDARRVCEDALVHHETEGRAVQQGASCVHVMVGVCQSVLARATLQADAESQQALHHADNCIEELEAHIWDISDSKEDKEAMSTAVATAYQLRGQCDFIQGRYEVATSWYGRALKCLEHHRDLGTDPAQISEVIKMDIERAEALKPENA